MSYNVRDPAMENLQRALGRKISGALPEGWGFMLMLFKHGEDRVAFYISDSERAGVIATMKEWIARQEN